MRGCKTKTLLLCLVLLFVFSTSTVHASQSTKSFDNRPSSWLQQISDSTAKQSYQGVFVYRCDAQLVAMKIIHAADESNGHEKLISLNGPAHEIVQNGHSITSSLFRGKRSMARGGRNQSIFGPFEKILDAHYKIVEVGEDRIANRPTEVFEIQPKDEFRYGFLIWVDVETGIVLRSDMADEAGKVIEQVMFIDVEMLADHEAESFVGQVDVGAESDEEANAGPKTMPVTDTKWQVAKMPSGFQLSERYMREGVATTGGIQEQLVFTDGLASVSVFIEPRHETEEPMLGQTRVGAVNVYGKVVSNHQITVVGDVPKATVEYIVGSLSLQR